jgi:hypothetical protein
MSSIEKKSVEVEDRKAPVATPDTRSEKFEFGGESSLPPPPVLTEEQEKKLWRKIDIRLMPILATLVCGQLFAVLARVRPG